MYNAYDCSILVAWGVYTHTLSFVLHVVPDLGDICGLDGDIASLVWGLFLPTSIDCVAGDDDPRIVSLSKSCSVSFSLIGYLVRLLSHSSNLEVESNVSVYRRKRLL